MFHYTGDDIHYIIHAGKVWVIQLGEPFSPYREVGADGRHVGQLRLELFGEVYRLAGPDLRAGAGGEPEERRPLGLEEVWIPWGIHEHEPWLIRTGRPEDVRHTCR